MVFVALSFVLRGSSSSDLQALFFLQRPIAAIA
jgi:hypothetical protein